MSVRIGINPITWTNDDVPELGGDTPLETCLAETRLAGYVGTELGGKFPREAAVLGPILERHGLALVSGWYDGRCAEREVAEEWDAILPHLALLKAMGSLVFVFAETSNAVHGNRKAPMHSTPRLKPEDWRQFGARMSDIADFVQGEGLRFAYHHHLGTVVERPGDLDAFLRATSQSVGLTLDTGHAALGGIDPVAVIQAHPDRIAHVHCKDIRGAVHETARAHGKSFLDGVVAGMFTVPGDGDLDFAEVMRALARIGYGGWIIVEAEQDPAIANPKHYGEIGLRTLRREAAAAGLI